MKHRAWNQWVKRLGLLFLSSYALCAHALELDWSGQFWAEFNFVHNYSMDNSSTLDTTRYGKYGYYAPAAGTSDTTFQSVFLRLRPKLVVNDNIYIKSEWWVGDPIFGLFGSGVPYSVDQRQYYSTQSRGSLISAQRIWAEFLTDVGTFQVGRVPLNWGLGVFWNSGDRLWDRYMTTADAIRWIAKFGAFSVAPSLIVSSMGTSIGGSCVATGGICTPGNGPGGVVDYSILLKYENLDEELEGGINVIKRLGGSGQDATTGILVPQAGLSQIASGINVTAYDIYAKKRFKNLSLGIEVPIVSGSLGSMPYQTFAVAEETTWKPIEALELMLKLGYAPGQSNVTNPNGMTYQAFYFNPNYHIGNILFNYQLANFSGAQTLNNLGVSQMALSSPYDNPIVNAAYAALSANVRPWEKWNIRPGLVYAIAPQTAVNGQYFLNYWTRTVQANNSGKNQGNALGFEVDLGVTFQWDEYFQFSLDNGLFFPGSFYAFTNAAGLDNNVSVVWASSLRVGVSF